MVPNVAVIAPACDIVTVGEPVVPAINANTPDETITVFPPLVTSNPVETGVKPDSSITPLAVHEKTFDAPNHPAPSDPILARWVVAS